MTDRQPESGYFADYHNVRVGVGELKTVDGLQPDHPERWEAMSTNERIGALQEAENRLANVQGRTPEVVHGERMGPTEYGYFTDAPGHRGIYVNTHEDMLNNRAASLDTVAHEGRHAYQSHALKNPGFHPEDHEKALGDSQVRDPNREATAWFRNERVDGYKNIDSHGYEAYMKQPVERDAGGFGTAVSKGLYPDYQPQRDPVNDYNFKNAQNKYGALKTQSQQPMSFSESFGGGKGGARASNWAELAAKREASNVAPPKLKQ